MVSPMTIVTSCGGALRRFSLQRLMECDHEGHRREHNTSDLRHCEQMKYQDFEERLPSAKLLR